MVRRELRGKDWFIRISFLSLHYQIFVWIWLYPPGNGGCGGKIQEKNSLLVHAPKLQTMIENNIQYKYSAKTKYANIQKLNKFETDLVSSWMGFLDHLRVWRTDRKNPIHYDLGVNKYDTAFRSSLIVFLDQNWSKMLLSKTQKVKQYDNYFFLVGLWSQSADKLTIHAIPCSWIL